MKVTVVSRSGREIVKGGIDLNDSATVSDLQEAIHERSQSPPDMKQDNDRVHIDEAIDLGEAGNTHPATTGAKRKFTSMLSDFGGEKLNARYQDGSRDEDDVKGQVSDEILRKVYDDFLEMHRPFYVPELIPMGVLQNDLYMLVPSDWPIPTCPIEKVRKGTWQHEIPDYIIAAVYALAKAQYEAIDPLLAVKWGTLRMEAFKAGWFDGQAYSKLVPAPVNSCGIMLGDSARIEENASIASSICQFIPFLFEFCFRHHGVAYTKLSASEYVARAKKLASLAKLDGILNYLPNEVLYGQAPTWIGVRRPMEVLKLERNSLTIPDVFRVRLNYAPAGQALITTSCAIIRSLISANLWEKIKEAGGYEDLPLHIVDEKILADPWRYHLQSYVYGVPTLTNEEKLEVETAKKLAIDYAPVLQAYCDTVMKHSSLSNVKVLKRHSDFNPVLYSRAKKVFRSARRLNKNQLTKQSIEQAFGTWTHATDGPSDG